MIFTLVAIPHIVFIQSVTLAELLKTVSQSYNAAVTTRIIIQLLWKLNWLYKEVKQRRLNILMPYELYLEFFTCDFSFIAEQCVVFLNVSFF